MGRGKRGVPSGTSNKMIVFRVTLVLYVFYFVTLFNEASLKSSKSEFILLTVATNSTDGFNRFIRSAKVYNIPVKVLGLGEKWKGGDMRFKGGGFKINLLKKELEKFKDVKDKIVMFTDSYDVILLSDALQIISQFEKFDAKIVFGAEGFCWPDETLATEYPAVQRGKKFLNSGGFIGYAPELYKLLTSSDVADTDDDQLFYSEVYVNNKLRNDLKIKLDHKSEIFQNLYGALGDVELRFKDHDAFVQNTAYNTLPLVLHGNGRSKLQLNSLGNYLAQSWTLDDGCVSCVNPPVIKDYPVILAAVFIEQPTPFFEEFLQKFHNQIYPKEKIHLFIHNAHEFHSQDIEDFIEIDGDDYLSIKTINVGDNVEEWQARNLALQYCESKKCDMYFNIDSEVHLDNPHTLLKLMDYAFDNRSVVAPLLLRPYKAWSNFWGAMTNEGFYARSADYMQIIHNDRRGIWNVPYVSGCYLMNSSLLSNPLTRPTFKGVMDPDMNFCASLRDKDIFMFVSNMIDFGHLVNPETFDITKTNSEIYQLLDNQWDWEQRYIHSNYTENFNSNKSIQQPCPDVYWFPIVSPRFCQEFIDIMETFGKWSDGSNNDERLDGGYENVPTRDIHMKQVGLEPMWLHFLKEYVRPLQELVFTGYFHDPPRSLMNFVVRYRPDEQPSLRPHHDSSTYTINIALNRPNIDYQGGGCKFIRYNCSVTDTRLGWLLMHPGRLTHYHEGLQVTNGTRYIMISFVDP